MKRIAKTIFTLVLLMSMLSCYGAARSLAAEAGAETSVESMHQLYLDVKFNSNLFFDIYDVDVYVDQVKVGNIPHGDNFTLLLEVSDGTHEVMFMNEGNDDVRARKSLTVNGDMTFKCAIKGHSSSIEVTDVELIDEVVGHSIITNNYIGKILEDALSELKEQGFINVEYDSADESDSIWNTSNWLVVSQNIDPGNELDKNDKIKLKCEKIENYLNNNYAGLTIPGTVEKAEELQHILAYKNALTNEYFATDLSEMSEEEQENWIVHSADKAEYTEGKATLLMIYTGDREVPNVTGETLDEAVRKLRSEDFSNIDSKSDDGSMIWNSGNWKVTEQSASEGDVVKANEKIVLTCHHIDKEDEKEEDDGTPKEYKRALRSAQRYSDNLHMSKAAIYDQLVSEYGENVSEEAAQYAIDNVEADWEENALKKADSYANRSHMSKAGVYDQLVSEYGEQFTKDEARYAIDNVEADWEENALKTADSYANRLHMSKAGVYDQLVSEYGEQFTEDEAQYAIDNVEVDWEENALVTAKSYRRTMDMSDKEIYNQLVSKYGEKFTAEEAQYAVDHLDD